MATLSIEAVLAFYDGAVASDREHSSAINALLGEELGIELLLHALRARGASEVVALAELCTQRTNAGVRLDRWVRVVREGRSVLYQVEVKNWCAHSIGGRRLTIDADGPALSAHASAMWRRYWDAVEHRPVEEPLQKVLVPMRVPDGFMVDAVEPIACVWDLLHPQGELVPWFDVPAAGAFARLNWFSMSAYLRTLLRGGATQIDVPMPRLEARVQAMTRMIPALRAVAASA